MNITCGPYVLEPDGSLALLPWPLNERLPAFRRIKHDQPPPTFFEPNIAYLSAETEDLLPYEARWTWVPMRSWLHAHDPPFESTRVFALTKEHFDAWLETVRLAMRFVAFARLFIGDCSKCEGRGWHFASHHPADVPWRENCPACGATGSLLGKT